MTGFAKFWRILTAVLTVLAALALIVQAVDLYRAGNAPENIAGNGVFIEPVFSRENVEQRLGRIAPVLSAWSVCALAGLFLPQKEKAGENPPVSQKTVRRKNGAVRIVVGLAAAALIILGVLNGGMRDVLVKAINICTECIGLG